jgi:hypothetical protein
MYVGRHAIVTHLGVGDGIIQSGLVIALLERYEELAFPAYPQHVKTFSSIFDDQPRISVYPVPQVKGEDWGSPRDATYTGAIEAAGLNPQLQIRLGIYAGHGIGLDFSKSFYEHARVDFEAKWRLCPIPKVWAKVPQTDPPFMLNGDRRIFLHDDHARGFTIQRRYIPKGFVLSPTKDIDHSILRYARYIISADEVHCIDSSFLWLADSLPTTGRLFLHRYARWQRPRGFVYETFRYWNYI